MPSGAAEAQSWLSVLLAEFARSGVDAGAWLLGAARLVPSVLLIPAFGLRALPWMARVLFAFVLAGSISPALSPLVVGDDGWLWRLLGEVLKGLPIAVSSAATLWAATMAGNLIDELGGGSVTAEAFATSDSAAGPFGILLSLAAAVGFLEVGGPVRLASALSEPVALTHQSLQQVVTSLVGGVQIAVLLGAPLLVLTIFVLVFHGLISRATNAALWSSLLGPLRALLLLGAVALLLDRLLEGWLLWANARLGAALP
jgi:type III secretory pathway component EscT